MAIGDWLEAEFGRVVPSGDDLRIDCPFCKEREGESDTKQHLYVSRVKPVAHCFRCDWGGTHVQLVKQVTDAESYAEAYRRLEDPSRMSMRNYVSVSEQLAQMFKEEGSQEKVEREMPEWFAAFSVGKVRDAYQKILLSYAIRRMTPNDIIWHGVGYCTNPNDKLWGYRVVFPVERGFWQARSIGNGSRSKYLSPKEDKQDRLWNYVALERFGEIYVAEGIISAMALGSNAIAVLGKSATPSQIKRIARSRVREVTIAFDAGTQFSESVMELASILDAAGKRVIIRKYAEGDPDSCQVWEEEEFSWHYGLFKS